MNKDTILEILNSESETLLVSDVRNILDEELNKPEDEMDLDLIELCMDAIESAQAKQSTKKRVRIRFTKALIAAVIFALLVGLTIPVCAKYFNINVPNGIVEFYGDHFDVDISGNEYVDDIAVELEKNGIEDVVLPEFVFIKDTKNYNFDTQKDDGCKTVIFSTQSNNTIGKITIRKLDGNYVLEDYQDKIESSIENLELICVNNINILVYSIENSSYIEYNYKNNIYSIALLDCDYNTACQIAQTI